MTADPMLAAAAAGLLAAVGGLAVPRLVAALPEPPADPPEPDPGPASGADAPVPDPTDAPAAAPGDTRAGDPREHAGGEQDVDVAQPVTPAAGRRLAPPVPPKIPYAELARRSHLAAWCALFAGLLAAAMGLSRGFEPDLPVWVFLAVLGVALSYVDWRTRLLPARLVAPAYAVVGALLLLAAAVQWSDGGREALARAAICWLAVFAVFYLLWFVYPRGLGYGDVRLSGVLGMALGWLGVPAVVVGVYAGFLLGAVVGGVLALARIVDRKGYPFGPFMLVGAFLGVLHADGHLLWWL